LAVLNHGHMARLRSVGKVQALQDALDAKPLHGSIGIAHTRWATHGVPTTENARPHISQGGHRHRAQRHHRKSRGVAR
jgi:glutamine---fructose-6-phosphate transaminase (isomerizing)